MIKMQDKQSIIQLRVREHMSLRGIAKCLHINRETVTKVIREYESCIGEDCSEESLNNYLAQLPEYSQSKVRPARVMKGLVKEQIDKYLIENKSRKSLGINKQCLNAKDIHRLLLEQGLVVSYSSVCKYLQKIKSKSAGSSSSVGDVFIHQEYSPGVECEFDWGEVKLLIGGSLCRFTMAVFTLCHSNGRYAYLFRHQDALALMEAHRNCFRDLGGVPQTMVYDNMRVAVAFTDDGKKPTETMRRLANFYGFAIRFCNARSGWEKGHVERSVEIVRSRAFKPRIDFDSIEQAQQWLCKACEQLNGEFGTYGTRDRARLLNEDKLSLMPKRGDIGCFQIISAKADKSSTIVYEYCHYSVPEELARKNVFLKVYSEKLEICDESRERVAVHERSYIRGKWLVDINHFLKTLMKKEGAIAGSSALHQMPIKMQELFSKYFKDNGRDFIRLLSFIKENGYCYEDILQAVKELRAGGYSKNICSDAIKIAITAAHSTEQISETARNSDDFTMIELGSSDILRELSSLMGDANQKEEERNND